MQKLGLLRQVVSHGRFTLYEFSRVETENNGLPKEVDLPWQLSLKTGFTVNTLFNLIIPLILKKNV